MKEFMPELSKKKKGLVIGLITGLVAVSIIAVAAPVALNESFKSVELDSVEPSSTALKMNFQETVWDTPGPVKITPDNELLTNNHLLSTKNAELVAFDAISEENKQTIPADSGRTIISKDATTFSKEFAKNNNLYIYFVIKTAGTDLRGSTGTFEATYDLSTKESDERTVQNIPIEVRVSENFNSRGTYDTLASFTTNFKYNYFFRVDPEGSGDQILTLAINDFEIMFGGSAILLKETTRDYRVPDKHPPDTMLFQASSVIGTGF